MPSISQNNANGGNGMADSTISKFTKILPLSIRKEGGGLISSGEVSSGIHHQGEQKEHVRVTLTYPSPACGAMNPHKEIALRLTNDDNPGFFYHLKITDADFPDLKSEQGLLVDFYGFPNQLVTLLEKCDLNYSSDDSPGYGNSSGPKFVLVMKIGGNNTLLDIVESNPFKYLCHLSLKISSGTDGEVKKYLCDVTTGLKKDLHLLQEKYNHLASTMEQENTRIKELLEQKNLEFNKLREDLHSQASSLSTKHFEDMSQEKEKLLKLQSDLASKFDHERSELERRHSQATSALEDRISSLEAENRNLSQIKYKNEISLQDAADKVKRCENDLRLLQQELTLMKKQNEKLDFDYHEKQKMTNNLHNRVTTLEADLREKQNILQKQHEQISELSEQKKYLEEHVTAMVNELERVKNVNKMVSGELMKANEIIKKLQDDIRNLNSKSKLQTQITTEQERTIADQDKQIHQLESELSSVNNSLSDLESEVKKLTDASKDADSKIEELEKTIKSHENMISWLNKQLNEFQGLSNLSKFRQNLALSYPNSAHPVPPPPASDNMFQNQNNGNNISSASALQPNRSHMIDTLANTDRRGIFGVANQSHNTLPNGTPSWMHIYHSTSTPLEDDLSSRLEKVIASTGNMNYNDLKSRFADRITPDGGVNNQQDKSQANSATGSGRGGNEIINIDAKQKSSARPPTWARGRGGRVTLETGTTVTNPKTSTTGQIRR